MATTLRKFKWFWAWQDDREEAWLEAMSKQGLHLTKLGLPGQYIFEEGEPRTYAYRLDYIMTPQKERAAYYQLFRDAGWEHIGAMSNWQYWRKEATGGETPEIFTDVESKVQKYRRLLGFLVIFLPIYMNILLTNVGRDRGFFGFIVNVLFMIIMVIYIYCILNLIRRIGKLKRL